jgi:very-short-patch-repair endonuclease
MTILQEIHRRPEMINRVREVRRENGKRCKGRIFSPATKAKMGKSQRARFKNVPVWNKGKPWSPKTLAAIRAGQARAFARPMKPTSIEKILYGILDGTGMAWTREIKISYWQVDTFIPELNAVIEANGDYWHSLPKNIANDGRKRTYLENHGYHVLFLMGTELMNGEAKPKLLNWIESLKSNTSPPPSPSMI